ncbi:AraC family transcriptional regulator [bacterium 210820-DFI.6.37]|nr:AraC family transcriptional regulator [bacterium 210820-DFI.6.37]
MFLEKKPYQDDFPINIEIVKIEEYPIHYHQDIEFVFVLKGQIKLKNGYCRYLLREGDIFTNTGHEVHALYGADHDNIVAIISINNFFFTRYFPELHRACYRTYSKKNTARLSVLRKMLLNLLLVYLQKSFDYKQHCIDIALELIEYMNAYFNLFAFEDKVVVNFKSDDPVIIERIAHIINYLYENHSSKITLEEIAEMEHLSTFYISHLIREYIGMSFRELLCFARAEWSEIHLLGSEDKISTIAKTVGFSTTAYYEKYFKKWFGRTPQDHRKLYKPLILSHSRPQKTSWIPANQIITIVRLQLSTETAQENSLASVQTRIFHIFVSSDERSGQSLSPALELIVTPEDHRVLGPALFSTLAELPCSSITIKAQPDTDPGELRRLQTRLEEICRPQISCAPSPNQPIYAGCDSAAGLLWVFVQYLSINRTLPQLALRDQGDPDILLKGFRSLLTSSGLPKPIYYGCRFLSKLRGQLISQGKYYAVIRLAGSQAAYAVLAFNYSREIIWLNQRKNTFHETDQILKSFRDELNITFSLKLPPGKYLISSHTLDSRNNLFDLMAKLDFPDTFHTGDLTGLKAFTRPYTDTFPETVSDHLEICVSLKGASAQLTLIQPVISL